MIRVTAAIIERNERLLLARRGPNMRMAGKWEFPGGKIEPGESAEVCLRRELREELGIDVAVGRLMASNRHSYGEMAIELLAFEVEIVHGEPVAREHDALAWASRTDLMTYDLAEADVPIAQVLLESGRG